MTEQEILGVISAAMAYSVIAALFFACNDKLANFFDALCWPIYFVKEVLIALYTALFTGWKP